jgi:glucose 1-dehydrogenase
MTSTTLHMIVVWLTKNAYLARAHSSTPEPSSTSFAAWRRFPAHTMRTLLTFTVRLLCRMKEGNTAMADMQRAAVVTGGSLGIGAAIARRLGRAGFAVVIDYHTHAAPAQAIQQELEQAGGKALAVQSDMSQISEIQKLIQACADNFGRIDVLVNNAGIEKPMPFFDITEDQWDSQLAVDLKGPFFATQFAAKLMAGQGGGKIINISSVHEDVPMVGNAPYCCAKGGLRMMTRTLASELAPHNITIVNVGPGAINTPINAATLSDPQKSAALLGEIPLKRIGQPEDVANLVAWLTSDDASYITGTTYFVDGGLMVYAGSL